MSEMTTIAGADGCKTGWICIFEELPSRRLGSKIFGTVAELLAVAPELRLLAIDIPIGMTEAGPRACDVAARKRLGAKRGTSVFPAPIRPALDATSYPGACDISERVQQRSVSQQGWAIYDKIRELDDLLCQRPELRERVYEIHPEVTFAEWAGAPILEPKRKRPGFAVRHHLVAQHFGADAFQTVRDRYTRKEVANDDILDAFAALWTAERIAAGTSRTVPPNPSLDSLGLPMRIVM
jgi:predicted RNase H-like nuclease